MSDLRYPIGRFEYRAPSTIEERHRQIAEIRSAPVVLQATVRGLADSQLDTPHRPGGWTVRQVVHHLVDSHLNAYLRIKLALTETRPTIVPYNEVRWAEGVDYRRPVEGSLDLLALLHDRWIAVLEAVEPADFDRTFVHPEHRTPFTVDHAVAMYAWHGRHHTAHVSALRERQGW